MPGVVHGFHEGSRSEYLAQYVFSAFGTSSAIPHQEDHGFDLYCTLSQRSGNVAWPDLPYTVQVKSDFKPWSFENPKAVEWLIKHPLPLFLCVITKPQLQLRVYQTTPRFYFWTSQQIPTCLNLVPDEAATEGGGKGWHDATSTSLGAPILNVTLGELADRDTFANAQKVLRTWLGLDYENLFRIASRLPMYVSPYRYWTNKPVTENGQDVAGRGIQWLNVADEAVVTDALSSTKDVVAWATVHLTKQKEWRRAIRAALFFRCFWPNEKGGLFGDFCERLRQATGTTGPGYLTKEIDEIAVRLDGIIDSFIGDKDDPTKFEKP
jgi:hypothetical protein